mgnify:CR=1 FL=1
MTTTTSLLKVITQLADKLCEPYFYANTPAGKACDDENIVFCAAGDGLIDCREDTPQKQASNGQVRNPCHFVQVTPYTDDPRTTDRMMRYSSLLRK